MSPAAQRVLVTGARGLIGSHVRRRLVVAGATVHAAARGARPVGARLVLAGTMEELFPGEGVDAAPRSPYAASKWAAAAYARVFGNKLVPQTIVSRLHGEPPGLAGGRRMSHWIHVHDVADACVAAIAAASPEIPTIDVGSGEMRSLRDVVELDDGLRDTMAWYSGAQSGRSTA